jgi:predicted  nucleic acid-binding Zn-ribbon protein
VDWRLELRGALALQELDRHLDALRAERRALAADPELASLEREVRARRQELQELQAELAETERRQRLQELERQSREAERERDTQRLYGGAVRSARDVAGLQKNIENVAALIGDLETSILEAMERADTLRRRCTEVQAALEQAMAAARERRDAVRARVADIDRHLPPLEAEREAAARALAPEMLREYERVRTRAGGVAVAAMNGRACGACGTELSPLLLARVRRGDRPVACEQCGRLVVEPA